MTSSIARSRKSSHSWKQIVDDLQNKNWYWLGDNVLFRLIRYTTFYSFCEQTNYVVFFKKKNFLFVFHCLHLGFRSSVWLIDAAATWRSTWHLCVAHIFSLWCVKTLLFTVETVIGQKESSSESRSQTSPRLVIGPKELSSELINWSLINWLIYITNITTISSEVIW